MTISLLMFNSNNHPGQRKTRGRWRMKDRMKMACVCVGGGGITARGFGYSPPSMMLRCLLLTKKSSNCWSQSGFETHQFPAEIQSESGGLPQTTVCLNQWCAAPFNAHLLQKMSTLMRNALSSFPDSQYLSKILLNIHFISHNCSLRNVSSTLLILYFAKNV